MIRIVSTALVCAVLGAGCQASMNVEFGDGDFSKNRLDRIGGVIQEEIDEGRIPGAVALVIKDGRVVYHEAFGYADIASGKPMEKDSIFRIASMTKAITSVAVMMLYEEGHFRLGDPVSRYLPEFGRMEVIELDADGNVTGTRAAATPIRIIDLLSHSSGISYPFIPTPLKKYYDEAGVMQGITKDGATLKSQMQLLAEQPLLFDPGSSFAYGLSTDVLGYLVEEISGMPLDRFFAERITGPLGMDDTCFYLPADKANRLVTLYSQVEGRGLVVSDGTVGDIKMDNPNYPLATDLALFSGGAGLSSTAEDYGRFLTMLLNEGELDGTRILSRKSIELMRTPRIDWDDDGDPDFGLGFHVVTNLGEGTELGSPGNYSWGGAFYTMYWIDPVENLAGVLMSQGRPLESDLRLTYPVLVYQALQ